MPQVASYFMSITSMVLPTILQQATLLAPMSQRKKLRLREVQTLAPWERRWQNAAFQPALSASESILFPENHGYPDVCDLGMVSLSCYEEFYP